MSIKYQVEISLGKNFDHFGFGNPNFKRNPVSARVSTHRLALIIGIAQIYIPI